MISRVMKKSLLVFALFVFMLAGCATTKVIDRLPPGTPKGFVEFRKEWFTDGHGPCTIISAPNEFISIDEISPDGKVIGTEKWSNLDGHFKISAINGYHDYELSYYSSLWQREFSLKKGIGKCRVRVYEGMITPVLIAMMVEGTTEGSSGWDRQATKASVHIVVESPIPQKDKNGKMRTLEKTK